MNLLNGIHLKGFTKFVISPCLWQKLAYFEPNLPGDVQDTCQICCSGNRKQPARAFPQLWLLACKELAPAGSFFYAPKNRSPPYAEVSGSHSAISKQRLTLLRKERIFFLVGLDMLMCEVLLCFSGFASLQGIS